MSILVASLLYYQEKLTVLKIVGCMFGFSGVLINVSVVNLQMSLLGEGLVFCSVIVYALSIIYIKRYSVIEHPIILSGYRFLIGGIIISALGMFMGVSLGQ